MTNREPTGDHLETTWRPPGDHRGMEPPKGPVKTRPVINGAGIFFTSAELKSDRDNCPETFSNCLLTFLKSRSL